jgi:hypothetical protein
MVLALVFALGALVVTGCGKSGAGGSKKGGDADSAKAAMMKATGGKGTADLKGETR